MNNDAIDRGIAKVRELMKHWAYADYKQLDDLKDVLEAMREPVPDMDGDGRLDLPFEAESEYLYQKKIKELEEEIKRWKEPRKEIYIPLNKYKDNYVDPIREVYEKWRDKKVVDPDKWRKELWKAVKKYCEEDA